MSGGVGVFGYLVMRIINAAQGHNASVLCNQLQIFVSDSK